jgi:hypothetical protein
MVPQKKESQSLIKNFASSTTLNQAKVISTAKLVVQSKRKLCDKDESNENDNEIEEKKQKIDDLLKQYGSAGSSQSQESQETYVSSSSYFSSSNTSSRQSSIKSSPVLSSLLSLVDEKLSETFKQCDTTSPSSMAKLETKSLSRHASPICIKSNKQEKSFELNEYSDKSTNNKTNRTLQDETNKFSSNNNKITKKSSSMDSNSKKTLVNTNTSKITSFFPQYERSVNKFSIKK